MKNLLYIISMAILLAACTNDIENDAIQTDILTLTVGDFPAFGEDAATRAIGTTDADGKSAWEAGDQLLVSVTCSSAEPQYAVMNYDGSTWTTTPTLKQTSATYTVTAWYAPAYEWDTTNGTLKLQDEQQAGLDEYICSTGNNSPDITFMSSGRNYSRLRIASTSSTQLSVSLTGFTPAGSTASTDNTYTLTTDSKGNAYLYGTWTINSNLQVTAQYSASTTTELYNKALSHASANGQSFAANAIPTSEQASNYDSLGDGSEEYPYVLLNATQLISLSNKSKDNQNITEHFKLGADITLTESWTPITTVDEHGYGSQFLGTFDGDGHTIFGLKFNLSDYIAGLFGMIGTSGVVKNVKLKDCNISVSSPGQICGGIAGVNYGTIENCHIIGGKITSESDAGGLAGICWYGDGAPRIVACSNSAAITGTYRMGGIVGWGREGSLIGCCNTGIVAGNSNMTVGGIVGIRDFSHLTACYFSAGNDNGYGTQITNNDWSSAITDMNNALQEAGYDYQWVLENGQPVINTP